MKMIWLTVQVVIASAVGRLKPVYVGPASKALAGFLFSISQELASSRAWVPGGYGTVAP